MNEGDMTRRKCRHHSRIGVKDGRLVCLDCGTPVVFYVREQDPHDEDWRLPDVEIEEEGNERTH